MKKRPVKEESLFFFWPVQWADCTGWATWHGRGNCELTILSQPALLYFTHMQMQNISTVHTALLNCLTPSKASGMCLSHTYQMLNIVVVKRNRKRTNRFSNRYGAGISVCTDLKKQKKTIVDVCCFVRINNALSFIHADKGYTNNHAIFMGDRPSLSTKALVQKWFN